MPPRSEDDDDDSDKEDGVVGNLQQQIRTQYDKGMLELRLQLVRMRTEYLNNINTQSTLLVSTRTRVRFAVRSPGTSLLLTHI